MGMRMGSRIFWLIVWFTLFALPGYAQTIEQEGSSRIIINIPSCTLELYKNNMLVREYPVGVGKPSTPTPIGKFFVTEKEIDPCWYPPGKNYVVPPGPENPLGYRWMGFAPLYGIHGTNAPWSIGLAVSNGCVRMQEADVEELFELIDYDTPVFIEYERVKVRVDALGRASIGIYSDIYGRQQVTLAGVKQALAEAGLDGLVEESFLQALLWDIPDKQVVFAQLHNLKINGVPRPEYAISWKGTKQVPVQALTESLNTYVNWDEDKQMLSRRNRIVPGIKLGNAMYAAAEDLAILFGGRGSWDGRQNCLELTLPIAKLDGQLLSDDIQRVENQFAVPALTLAKALGERVKWHSNTGQLFVQGRPAAVVVLEGEPFVTMDNMGEIFNVAAAWDDQTQTLHLSYPLHPIDYSMYLNPYDEFL